MNQQANAASIARPPSRAMTGGLAALALLAYSAAVAAGFVRVFSGWDFFDNLLVIAIVGHGLSYALRVARVPVLAAVPVTLVALIWLIAAMFYRETFALVLPTSETWSVFRLELDVVGNQFRTAVAPVAFLAGWDVLAAIGVASAVVLADTFAFRAFARAESLVPGGVLFVFVAALGNDRIRITSTMVLIATGVVATIVLRHHHAPDRRASIGAAPRAIAARAMPVAVGSALSIALIAGFIGPRLPGAGAEPIYETKGGGGSVTEVISPLVDIRSRLTNRSTTELFQVTATADSYWRSSALASFDGRRWGIPSRALEGTSGSIGQGVAGSVPIRQTITVTNLGGVLLPAAADPTNANGRDGLGDTLRYDPDSATLVKTGDELTSGDVFEVESASPRYTAEQLAAATSNDAGDPIYLDLPDDFPTSVEAITREVVGDFSSSYEAALLLQNWMRSEFTYSLEIQEGHGSNEIESFLRNRVGYCEQFAGTYAAMLRSIDIPARVAVGFTPGADDGAGNYSVLGRNAHAWPEVWFDGLGWVPFEPTPGRGAPNAENYTGVAQQQDDGPAGGDGDEAAETVPAPVETTNDPSAPTTVLGGGSPIPTTLPDAATPGGLPGDLEPEPVAATPADDAASSIPWRALTVVLLVAVVLAAPALVRRVRRSISSTPTEQLAALWQRAAGAVSEMGLERSPDLTPREVASETDRVFTPAARPMHSLADLVTEATFSEDGEQQLGGTGALGTTTMQSAASWCRQVERSVTESISPLARIRRYFTVLH